MKAKNGHTVEMAHRCPVRHFWLSAMPGIKKRKKSAHMARHDRGLQDTPDGLAVMVTALPSYTKARRDNRCPLPPLPAGRLPVPAPSFSPQPSYLSPGAGTLPFVSRHDGCALSGSCMQRVRDTSRSGVGLSTGKGRSAAPPCPPAWNTMASGRGRQECGRRTGTGTWPAPSPYPPSS